MNTSVLREIPTTVFLGICFSLVAVLLGFVMGGVFGAVEDSLKKSLDRSGTAVLESVYKSDIAAKDAVVKKSWEYFKRAHMHWSAISSAALVSILTLILVCQSTKTAQVTSILLGAGAFIYPLLLAFGRHFCAGNGRNGKSQRVLCFSGHVWSRFLHCRNNGNFALCYPRSLFGDV